MCNISTQDIAILRLQRNSFPERLLCSSLQYLPLITLTKHTHKRANTIVLTVTCTAQRSQTRGSSSKFIFCKPTTYCWTDDVSRINITSYIDFERGHFRKLTSYQIGKFHRSSTRSLPGRLCLWFLGSNILLLVNMSVQKFIGLPPSLNVQQRRLSSD